MTYGEESGIIAVKQREQSPQVMDGIQRGATMDDIFFEDLDKELDAWNANRPTERGVKVYRGSNTVSEHYRGSFIGFLIMCVVFGGFIVLAILKSGETLTDNLKYVILVVLVFGIPAVFDLIQYIHYRNVELTDVQFVVPKIAGSTARGEHWLTFNVIQNGVTQEVTTHIIFRGDVVDYVDKQQEVGYDPIRGRWVII